MLHFAITLPDQISRKTNPFVSDRSNVLHRDFPSGRSLSICAGANQNENSGAHSFIIDAPAYLGLRQPASAARTLSSVKEDPGRARLKSAIPTFTYRPGL